MKKSDRLKKMWVILIGITALFMFNSVTILADGISDAMQKVIDVYPNSCSYFTSDGKKDSNNSDSRCSLANIPSRGGLPSGKTVKEARGGDAHSCHGFAEYVWYVMFGHCITDNEAIPASQLKVGDFIRFSGHSAIYLGEDSQNYYVYDSNWAKPADNKVRYNHAIGKGRGVEKCYHAANYDEIAGKINNPWGYLDSCSGAEGRFNISGWARDDDEPDTGIEIHVYIGGPSGAAGAEGYSGIYANQYRSDVGNHAYSATLKTNKTGKQDIYIYGINVGGGSNALIATGTVTITPNEAPKISNVKITNLNENGFDVTCKVYDDGGIDKVQFPTWTRENGQDDLVWDWTTNAICSGKLDGNVASYHVNTSEHNGEKGLYYVHIYAFDNYGNRNNRTLAIYIGDNRYESEPIITEIYNGHVYMLFEGENCDGDKQMDWSEAASYCQSIGGTLVCITSAEENQVVASMVNKYGSPCWIGGNDLEQEGSFVWESGEPFSYMNWDAGEPNNAGNQDFIRMYTNGFWDDSEGSHYAFICEFDNLSGVIPRLSVKCAAEAITVTLSNTDLVTGYGLVCISGEEPEITLDTPGRTEVIFTELTQEKTFTYDTTGKSGCTYRAYAVYSDENGEENVEYSEPVFK